MQGIMEIDLRAQWRRFASSAIRRQTLGNYALKMAQMGLTFLGSMFLARVLGPDGFGIYSFSFSLVSILAIIAEFGLPTLVVRETAKDMAREEVSQVHGIWRWAVNISGALAFVIALVGGVFLIFNPAFVGERLETTLWALPLIPLLAIGDIRNAALRGLKRVIAGQLPELVLRPAFYLIFLVGWVWLLHWDISVPIVMRLYLLATGLAFGTGLWLWWQGTPEDIVLMAPEYKNRPWFKSTAPMAMLAIMSVANLYIATVLQGFLSVPNAEIGIFRVAQQISQLASLGLAINLVLGPRFAVLYAQNDRDSLQNLAVRSAQIVSSLYLGIAGFFLVFGRQFLGILFGSSFTAAYSILLILLAGQMVNAIVGSVGWILNMSGYEMVAAKIMSFSVVVNVALNLVLIPRMGIRGSAFATTISVTIWNVLLLWQVKARLGIVSLPFMFKGSR